MVDFDKFEKNVKNNYGNQEFPFDEQNWEKAAKMIDASRRGNKRGGIFLLSAVALLCTSGLVYYFGFSDSAKSLQKNDLAVNQAITANENTDSKNEISASEINSVVNATSDSHEENIQTGTNVTSSNETLGSENTSSTNASKIKTNSKSNISINNSTVSENLSNSKSTNENSNTTSNNETKAESKTNTASTNNTNETKSNNSLNSEGKKTIPPVLGSNNNASQNNVKSVTPNTNPTVTGNTERLGSSHNNSETPTKNNTVIDSTDIIATGVVMPTESIVVDSVPTMRKSKADSLALMQPKGDGISYATKVKEKHNAKNILFMEAGTTYLFGWNGGGQNEAGGFNLLAGINFQHYFTGTIAAQIGVQYSAIGNMTNTSHTIATVNYDFGMEQEVTSINYQKLHYLIAPIKVTYNVGDKNIIGLGCNIGYLLNSDIKKENYTTYSRDPNATKNDLTSTKENGYVQGFNPLDIQVGVSYRRKIYKGLSANAEFFYGLTDTKDNTFFKSNYFDRNVGFKVSLCYNLFKK